MNRPPPLVDRFSRGETIEFEVAAVLHSSRSPFQRIEILDLVGHGRTLVLDGSIQSAERDEHLYHEALVQPALLLLDAPPRRVLVLGGGEGATLREVLKHRSVERAVMCDLDPMVVEACRRHLPGHHRGAFDDPRAELVHDDALRFLERTAERFDAIVFDVVDPGDSGADAVAGPADHLFTRAFFAAAKARLRDGGAFAMQWGPAFPPHCARGLEVLATCRETFGRLLAGRVFVPVYQSPWGIAVAGVDLAPPDVLARRIAERLDATPRSLDADDVAPLLHLPLELRLPGGATGAA